MDLRVLLPGYSVPADTFAAKHGRIRLCGPVAALRLDEVDPIAVARRDGVITSHHDFEPAGLCGGYCKSAIATKHDDLL